MSTPKAIAREPPPEDAAGHAPKTESPTPPVTPTPAPELGGRSGLDPTRYGDWERAGRCIDF